MKKKFKYSLFFTFLLLLIIIKGCINILSGGYSEEVYTAFASSPGFNMADETFFTASYRLFRQTKGFRRFPDGGQSKRVYEAVYLVKMEKAGIKNIYKISNFILSDSDIKYTRGIKDKKDLKLLITEIGKDNYYIIDCSERKPDADKYSSEKISEAEFADPSLSITETKNIFKELIRIPESEIPSPLKYTDKNIKQLIKDVVRLEGDFYYRAAVIDKISDSELQKIPERMEKYEKSLKKGKLEYSIYSEDTKKYIEKRLGL